MNWYACKAEMYADGVMGTTTNDVDKMLHLVVVSKTVAQLTQANFNVDNFQKNLVAVKWQSCSRDSDIMAHNWATLYVPSKDTLSENHTISGGAGNDTITSGAGIRLTTKAQPMDQS